MLSRAEISRGLQGALKLLQRDPTAPAFFDNTTDACLRSFWVMAITAPVYALWAGISYAGVNVAADPGEIVLVEVLRFVVDWLLYPVLFYEIARRRRWLDRYPRYIGALNWINLPTTLLMLVNAIVISITPPPFRDLFFFAVFVLGCYWVVVATRMLLGVNWVFSILLLIVNVIPSLFLSTLVDRFLGVSAGG